MKKKTFLFLAAAAVLLAVSCNKATTWKQTTPKTAEGYYFKGFGYLENGDYDSAIEAFTQAIKLDPNFAMAYNSRGNVYANTNAWESLHMHLTTFEDFMKIPICLSSLLNSEPYPTSYVKGDYDLAIADYTQAIRLEPNFTAAYTNRGDAYVHKGDYDRAITDYESALQIHSGGLYYYLAKIGLEKAQRARAEVEYQRGGAGASGTKIVWCR